MVRHNNDLARNRRSKIKMSPKLVAMVSVYNSSQWLRDRIINLMETKIYARGELTIYLANANSPSADDDTICNEYVGRSNIKYERIGDCTVYGAWNHMVKNSNEPYITNANSDDLVSPECYDFLIETCEERQSHLSFVDWVTIGDEVKKWKDVAGPGNGVPAYNPTVDQYSCGHFPLWRRSLHDKIGFFDPWFKALGDADFWYRAWINEIRDFVPVGLQMAAYRWRDGQNLWNRTAEEQRTAEWERLRSRQPGQIICS